MYREAQDANVISAFRVARSLGRKIKASAWLSISVILFCIPETTHSVSPKNCPKILRLLGWCLTLGFLWKKQILRPILITFGYLLHIQSVIFSLYASTKIYGCLNKLFMFAIIKSRKHTNVLKLSIGSSYHWDTFQKQFVSAWQKNHI